MSSSAINGALGANNTAGRIDDLIDRFTVEDAPRNIRNARQATVGNRQTTVGNRQATVGNRQANDMPATFAQRQEANPRRLGMVRSAFQAIAGIPHDVKTWFTEMCKGAKAGLPDTIHIALPNGQGQVTYTAKELAPMIKSLPTSERQAARDTLVNHLADRLTSAADTIENVIRGRHPTGVCSQQDASDIMLFLDAKAKACGNGFSQGSYMLQDDTGELYEFLDTCNQKYLRSSTHMEDEQEILLEVNVGHQHTNAHRGIDMPSGLDGLPHGKKTILFATHLVNGEANQRRLFMKPEGFGARISTLFGSTRSEGRSIHPERPLHRSDIGELVGHTIAYIKTRGQATPNERKERIPSPVSNAYMDIAKKIGTLDTGVSMSLKPTDKHRGLSSMLDELVHMNRIVPADKRQAFDASVQKFADAVAKKYIHLNHLNERIGNEMIFNEVELTGAVPNRVMPLQDIAQKTQAILDIVYQS